MKNKKPLSDKMLERKVYREITRMHRLEKSLAMDRLKKLIQAGEVPDKWRTHNSKSLFQYLLYNVQLKWWPKKREDQLLFMELNKIE